MAWQDVFPVSSPRIDAEEDREQRLAMQARAGADWALTALIARYQPPVTRYLTRLTGNPDRARVLAERIFLRMERRIHGPHGGRYLRLWLLRSSTEDGLDALRRSRHVRSAARLGAPERPLRLLSAPGVAPHLDRLRAGLGTLAEVTGQTSRQVRKLIWRERDHERPGATSANTHSSPTADRVSEDGDDAVEQDPREALRYRVIRAVLAELPYADAQCVALHLVAGLNQAEVARALGLTNSATRRRIVQGLELFSRRFNAAVAALGLPPDVLAAVRGDARLDPLAPGVAGYVPYQEQPTSAYPSVTVSAAPLPEEERLVVEAAEPTTWLAQGASLANADGDDAGAPPILEGTVVEAVAAAAALPVSAEPLLTTPDTAPLPPRDAQQDDSLDVQPNDGDDDDAPTDDENPTLPRLTTLAARPAETSPRHAIPPAVRDWVAGSAEPAQDADNVPALVPVLSPVARVRVDTLPLRGRVRALSDLPVETEADEPAHSP